MKTNFFYSIKSDNYNESVDIYIGQSAGKQLQERIDQASKEVIIVSPYIDKTKIQTLIDLYKRGVDVKLAFSYLKDYDEQKRAEILRMLIEQVRYTDEEKKAYKVKMVKRYTIIRLILYVLLFVVGGLIVFNAMQTHDWSWLIYIVVMLVIGYFCHFFIVGKIDRIKEIPIYSYSYYQRLPFKCCYHGEEKFIHSKIYIIDRKYAYLGSMNFTKKGFISNFETRVRITHQQQIEELHRFVSDLFDDPYLYREVFGTNLIRDAKFHEPPY